MKERQLTANNAQNVATPDGEQAFKLGAEFTAKLGCKSLDIGNLTKQLRQQVCSAAVGMKELAAGHGEH